MPGLSPSTNALLFLGTLFFGNSSGVCCHLLTRLSIFLSSCYPLPPPSIDVSSSCIRSSLSFHYLPPSHPSCGTAWSVPEEADDGLFESSAGGQQSSVWTEAYGNGLGSETDDLDGDDDELAEDDDEEDEDSYKPRFFGSPVETPQIALPVQRPPANFLVGETNRPSLYPATYAAYQQPIDDLAEETEVESMADSSDSVATLAIPSLSKRQTVI